MINIQNIDDNECFKWYLVRYLNPVDHNPRRITKADKGFANKLDFENIKFPLKIRDIHKIEKNAQKNKTVSKKCSEEKRVDLLLIGEEVKRHYVLIKDFSTFRYDHTLLR